MHQPIVATPVMDDHSLLQWIEVALITMQETTSAAIFDRYEVFVKSVFSVAILEFFNWNHGMLWI